MGLHGAGALFVRQCIVGTLPAAQCDLVGVLVNTPNDASETERSQLEAIQAVLDLPTAVHPTPMLVFHTVTARHAPQTPPGTPHASNRASHNPARFLRRASQSERRAAAAEGLDRAATLLEHCLVFASPAAAAERLLFVACEVSPDPQFHHCPLPSSFIFIAGLCDTRVLVPPAR